MTKPVKPNRVIISNKKGESAISKKIDRTMPKIKGMASLKGVYL